MPDDLKAPRSASTDQRFYGVAEALVVDNEDPEKRGRVRVIFPWFDPGMESEWCRVSNLYAGNDYGSAFVPEVGDEVLVGFVHGDMRLPVILGGLYNGKDLPPTARAADKDQKMIRTKGKHELLMDDTSGEERVRVTTAGGHTLDLSDKDKLVNVKTTGGHAVALDDTGQKASIETASGQKVTMEDAGGKITIETSTGASITLDATGVTVKATSITLSAPSVGLGGSGGQPLVLGPAFMTLFSAHVHPTAIGPTGPPVPVPAPGLLTTVTKGM